MNAIANAILLETLYQKMLGRNKVRNVLLVPPTRFEFLQTVTRLLREMQAGLTTINFI